MFSNLASELISIAVQAFFITVAGWITVFAWQDGGVEMKRHANEFLRTTSGRLAGSGITYDRYDDESMPSGNNARQSNPVYTTEYIEYLKSLKEEQPVKVYKLTKEEMDEYLKRR